MRPPRCSASEFHECGNVSPTCLSCLVTRPHPLIARMSHEVQGHWPASPKRVKKASTTNTNNTTSTTSTTTTTLVRCLFRPTSTDIRIFLGDGFTSHLLFAWIDSGYISCVSPGVVAQFPRALFIRQSQKSTRKMGRAGDDFRYAAWFNSGYTLMRQFMDVGMFTHFLRENGPRTPRSCGPFLASPDEHKKFDFFWR